MTKSSLPLIIVLFVSLVLLPGEGRRLTFVSRVERRKDMRVHIYKNQDGTLTGFIEPSSGKGKPPVLVQALTPENAEAKILPAVQEMRSPRLPRGSDQPLG